MNWKWIMQERQRQNAAVGVLEEDPKVDAKKKKKVRGFSSLGKAIKLAVGGSPKREKPPDLNNSTPTPPPSPSTQPPKKHHWTTTINEKYHQLLNRRQKPKPRRHLPSDPIYDEEDPCSLGLPRRPNTALGIHDIDRSPYLSDLVPFLPDEEEEQYTPTWIKENLSRLFYERSGSPTPTPLGQRRPASAPCLDYPVGIPGGCLEGEMARMGSDRGGDDYPPAGRRRSLSAPVGSSPAVVGEGEDTDQGDGREGDSTMMGELSGEEDESVSDVS